MNVRHILVYAGLMGVTGVAGLAVRFVPLGLPAAVVKYGGSTMWALMIYWVLALVLRGWRPGWLVVLAGVVATAVEFLKLYRTPWLDAFRLTLPGILLLGRYFSVWDIVAYWVSIGVGAVVDEFVVRRVVLPREGPRGGSGRVRREAGPSTFPSTRFARSGFGRDDN